MVLVFNEPVEASLGSVRVFDGAARRVDTGRVERPAAEQLVVGLREGLPQGTYTVAWRAISADAHPIRGAFVFHIGAPGANPAGIHIAEDETPAWLDAVFAVDRFLVFALVLLAFGGSAALAFVVRTDDGVEDVRRTLFGALAAAGAALVAVSLASLPLQAAVAGGLSLGDALGRDALAAVLDTRFGEVAAARAGLAALFAVLAFVLARRGGGGILLHASLLVAALLLLTPAAAGHASVAGATAFVADVLHVLAAALWTGGLAFLVVGLLAAGNRRWTLASRSVPRFSTIAVGAVAVLVLAGSVMGYLQVGAWRGLWETTYGVLLLAKVGLVLPILALGAFNNRYAVPRLRDGVASAQERRRFLRTAGVELTLMTAVVAVTAMLVNQPPAKAEVGGEGPQAATAQLSDELELDVVVDPAVAGPNQIHLYVLDRSGQPRELESAVVTASLPSRRVGPLRFDAHKAGPGHYAVHGAQLAIPGTWQITVEAFEDEFTVLTAAVSIEIREE